MIFWDANIVFWQPRADRCLPPPLHSRHGTLCSYILWDWKGTDLASVVHFAELSPFPEKWNQVIGAEVIPATKK